MAYANSVDPDQTAPEGQVLSGSALFAIPLNMLGNNCIKSKIWAKRYRIKCSKFKDIYRMSMQCNSNVYPMHMPL